ncbi:MAG: 30S ribosomal protein S7 [Candidatus Paceibacterota bacterium]|jgi:small subunit ribosomal protein S7|nr:30S ribosomal protein S7 [Candidatus Nomurabacteria bacterium]
MRRKIKNKNIVEPDILYKSQKLAKFINNIMLHGKKETARKSVYKAFEIIKEKTGNPNPLEVFDTALKNAGPTVEVRSRRIGGANYQVPREVRPERRLALAMRWMIDAARSKKGAPIAEKLAEELILASKNEGSAIKKRDDTHKMAESNKAFAHFAW